MYATIGLRDLCSTVSFVSRIQMRILVSVSCCVPPVAYDFPRTLYEPRKLDPQLVTVRHDRLVAA